MAGSVFDHVLDPEEQANGAGFAALLRSMPSVASDDPDQGGSPVPAEASAASIAQAPMTDDRGMDQTPAGSGERPVPSAPSSPDLDLEAQSYGGDMPAFKQYGDHGADYAALQTQKAGEDPSKFKASGWRRALAAVAGGMVAAGSRDPAAGWKVGEGVLNAPLDRAKMQWAAQEAPLQAKLTADQAEDAQTYRTNQGIEQQGRLREQGMRNRYYGQMATEHAADFAAQAAARKNALVGFTPDDPSDRNSTGTGTTADGRTVKGAQAPAWYQDKWDKSPTNKANAEAQQGVATLRALEAAGVKLTPEQRAIVASGGKVTPSTRTTISIAENPDGSARTPGGRGAVRNADEYVDDIVAKATQDKQAFADQWQRVDAKSADAVTPEGSYQSVDGTKRISAKEFADRIEKFRTDANVKMTKYGASVDGQGNVQRQGPAPSATAPQAPAAAPKAVKVASGQTVKVGDPVTDGRGRTGTITGINPQTGKPKVKWSGAQ